MGLYDEFYVEFEGKNTCVQSKDFHCGLMQYRIGDVVNGRDGSIYRGAVALIEPTHDKAFPPWTILVLHDGIYVDYAFAMTPEDAKKTAEAMADTRVGERGGLAAQWKGTLARVVAERNTGKDKLARISLLVSWHATYESDPEKFESTRVRFGEMWKMPDFRDKSLMDCLREALDADVRGVEWGW